MFFNYKSIMKTSGESSSTHQAARKTIVLGRHLVLIVENDTLTH